MIDGGLRPTRPSGRHAPYRQEPAYHQPDESYRGEPAEPARGARARRAADEPVEASPRKPRTFGWLKWVVGVAVLAVIAVAGWLFVPTEQGIASTIAADKYQAVFLSNGQVYFGKMTVINNDFMKLTQVYYLERQLTADTETQSETESDTQTATTNDNNFQLLKYSDVLYGSEDAMVISRDDIVRFENLRNDGVVAKAIANRR